jgi:uncharacterized protein (DUF488 family)
MQEKHIFTIGHSNHTIETFIGMLQSFHIDWLADIRSFPGSRRLSHFNREALEISLPAHGIQYIHMKELGGRRKTDPGSKNTGWKNSSFRGYADYMETTEFKDALRGLEQLALQHRVAYMCSEALWWSCHRSLVSDALKAGGWTVTHIMGIGKSQEHRYTQPARIVEGKLSYRDDMLLF